MNCSFCGTAITGTGQFCPGCGKKTAPEPAPACASCGAETTKSQSFCTSCGAKANVSGQGFKAPPPPPPPPGTGPAKRASADRGQPVLQEKDEKPEKDILRPKDPVPLPGPERGAEGSQGSNLKGAGVGVRAAATALDVILFMIMSYILAAMSGTTTSGGFDLKGAPFFAAAVIIFVYYIVFEGSLGATPGKLVVGLRVMRRDGARCGFGPAAVRTVFRIIDGLFFYLPGAFFVWVTPLNQRLGDLVAGTLVVKSRKN